MHSGCCRFPTIWARGNRQPCSLFPLVRWHQIQTVFTSQFFARAIFLWVKDPSISSTTGDCYRYKNSHNNPPSDNQDEDLHFNMKWSKSEIFVSIILKKKDILNYIFFIFPVSIYELEHFHLPQSDEWQQHRRKVSLLNHLAENNPKRVIAFSLCRAELLWAFVQLSGFWTGSSNHHCQYFQFTLTGECQCYYDWIRLCWFIMTHYVNMLMFSRYDDCSTFIIYI